MRYFHLTTFKRFLITSFLHLTRINWVLQGNLVDNGNWPP